MDIFRYWAKGEPAHGYSILDTQAFWISAEYPSGYSQILDMGIKWKLKIHGYSIQGYHGYQIQHIYIAIDKRFVHIINNILHYNLKSCF